MAGRPGWMGLAAPRAGTGGGLFALALILVAVAGLISFAFSWFFNARGLAAPFLVALTLSGIWLGRQPTLAAVIPAFFAYNYFAVAPHFSLKFSPGDFLALTSFLATAVLVGGLAGELSDRARATANQLRLVTSLFAASRDLSAATTTVAVAESLARHLESADIEAAIWRRTSQGRTALTATEEARRAGALDAEPEDAMGVNARQPVLRPLATARGVVGLIVVWAPTDIDAHAESWMAALLQLGAIALDRASLSEEVSSARLVAEREGLRTALLSSLSHDLRTPIATIVASASSLSEYGPIFDEATRRELTEVIQDEGERLNRYVANLLEMTRLESGALDIRSALVDPAEPMSSALEHMRRRLKERRIVRHFDSAGVSVDVDPVLLEQALINVLENAAALSPQRSTIRADIQSRDGVVALSVTDEGPGISPEDLPHVFDKLFRGRGDRSGREGGVGLGLSVARGLVEAFGGTISAESPVKNGRGARFTVRLPSRPALGVVE